MTTPVCLGVMCDLRGTCRRYHDVDFADPQTLRIGHCPKDEHGGRRLFRPMFVLPVVPAQERRAAA